MIDHFTTQEHVGRNAAFLVILGTLLAMLGFIAVVSPLAAGLPPQYVVGLMLISRASMQFYYGVKVRHWGHGLGSYMGLGSVIMSFGSFACGVLLLFADSGVSSLGFMMVLLAAYLLVNGVFDVMHAIELREVDGWYVFIFNGLASLGLAAMVWYQWPVSGRWAIGILVGLSLMLSGLSQATLGLMGRNFLLRRRNNQMMAQQA